MGHIPWCPRIMTGKSRRFFEGSSLWAEFPFGQPVVFCVGTLLVVTGTLCAQDALPTPGAGNPAVDPVIQRNIDDWAILRRGLPDDWTHHYLVFSNPGTAQQAIENGKFEEWLKIVDDPRFTLQQIKRSAGAKALEGSGVSAASTPNEKVSGAGAPDNLPDTVWPFPPRKRKVALKKDWAVAFGGVAASGTGTVTTNNASGTSTVTVDGQTLTGSAPDDGKRHGNLHGCARRRSGRHDHQRRKRLEPYHQRDRVLRRGHGVSGANVHHGSHHHVHQLGGKQSPIH